MSSALFYGRLQSCRRNVRISTSGLARIKTRSGHLHLNLACLLSLAIRPFEKFDLSKTISHLFQKKKILCVGLKSLFQMAYN